MYMYHCTFVYGQTSECLLKFVKRGTSHCFIRPPIGHIITSMTISSVPWCIPEREAFWVVVLSA